MYWIESGGMATLKTPVGSQSIGGTANLTNATSSNP
jgi:hypothetical protein